MHHEIDVRRAEGWILMSVCSTQIPIDISEGLLTVAIFNALKRFNQGELREPEVLRKDEVQKGPLTFCSPSRGLGSNAGELRNREIG